MEQPTAAAPAEANRETELKLIVRPEDLAKLRQAPALAARSKGRAVTRTLASTYYDTPDMDLSARLVTLRVRKQGEHFIQTLKAGSAAGGITRPEWEWPVAGPDPDLTVIVEPEALAQLGTVSADMLKPVFASHVRRTIRIVNGGDTAIEVAFDQGEIRTPEGGAVPLSEVELELKQGSPAALFDLALDLAKVAPVRVEMRTKAARGYALAAGRIDGWSKADKLDLSPAATVEGTLCQIVRSCLFHFTANEACSLKGEDPEGVHQMRVALRRLRSALSLFRPFVPPEQHAWLVGEVKWLAGALGQARDWDVFSEELLDPVRQAFPDNGHTGTLPADLEALAAAARARRERAYEGVRAAIGSERYTQFQLRLGAWLEAKGWRAQPVNEQSVRLFQPVTTLADQLLEKRHRKARKAGRGFESLPPEARHQLRIALKKLRYAAEFFRALYEDKTARRYLQLLAGFQDSLGHLNDVATASRLLGSLGEDGPPLKAAEARASGIVIGWHARGVAEGEASLVRSWDRFAEAKPFWSKPPQMP